jgi:protein O-mannosyl-transferase
MSATQRILLIAVILLAVTFLLYSQVIRFGFLRYDDEIYVYENPHVRSLAVENIVWIFTHGYFKSYTPLALLSHALDYAVWGTDARGHHFTNLLLHAMNTVLVFLLALMIFTRWRRGGPVKSLFRESIREAGWDSIAGAIVAALLFAVHPLRVESVSWVSDRKDLLATFFLLPSLMWYLEAQGEMQFRRFQYALSVVLFGLAALTKSFVIVTPAFLVLADVFFLQRASLSVRGLVRLAVEKIPMFAISAAIAIAAQQSAGAENIPVVIERLTAFERALLPLYSPLFYLVKVIWPVGLTPIYIPPGMWILVVYSLVSVILILWTFILAKRGNAFPFVALGFYGFYMLPTLFGLSAGIQPWADRYTYLPMLGLALLAGGAVRAAWSGRRRVFIAGVSIAVLAICSALTMLQVPRWRDSLTLWSYASKVNPHTLTFVPLGISYVYEKMNDSAFACYKRAISLDSTIAFSHYNLGVLLENLHQEDEAIRAYVKAIECDPRYHYAWNNLAGILLRRGKVNEAQRAYRAVLESDPDNADAHFNLGVTYAQQGKKEEATGEYRDAIRFVPGYSGAYVNLGSLALTEGNVAEAIATFREGLKFDHKNSNLLFNLGVALEKARDTMGAVNSYTNAILADPRHSDPYVNLANLYANLGMVDGAVEVYKKAVDAGQDSVEVCFNYGLLLDGTGDTIKAREFYRRAIVRSDTFQLAYLNLARNFLRAQELDSAGLVYESALDRGLDSPQLRADVKSFASLRKRSHKK